MFPRVLNGILTRLARVIYAHAGIIVIATVLGTALAGYLAYTHFEIKNNIGSILDENSGSNRAYLKYKKEFNVDEEYVLVIRSDDPELNKKAADFLAEKIVSIGEGIRQVFYKIDFSKLAPKLLLYQNEEELKDIREQILGMTQQLEAENPHLDLATLLNQTTASFDDDYLRKKSNWKEFKPFIARFLAMIERLADALEGKTIAPLPNSFGDTAAVGEEKEKQDARDAADEPAKSSTDSNSLTIEKDEESEMIGPEQVAQLIKDNEYVTYLDGKMLLVLATPGVRETDSTSPYTTTLRKIREHIKETEAKFPGVTIGLTGEPVLNDDEMQTAMVDAIWASSITFALITVLFIVGYRERTRPFLAILTLLLAVVWSFAFTMLWVGHLNVITQAFVPMMLGLGIDFGIQILGRYEEELAKGK
ncbi:MAG: MMPL family transporter, partial [Verrucomicrobiota bacterium]